MQLVPVSALPQRFRSMFHFPLFNAVQSYVEKMQTKIQNPAVGADPLVALTSPPFQNLLRICAFYSVLLSDINKVSLLYHDIRSHKATTMQSSLLQ